MNTLIAAFPPVDTAWDTQDVASFLKISERGLYDLRQEDPTFPAPRMIGRLPRWSPLVVMAWLAGIDLADLVAAEPVKPAKEKSGTPGRKKAAHHV